MTLGYFDNRPAAFNATERKAALLAEIRRGNMLQEAQAATQIRASTVDYWRKRDAVFRGDLKAALKTPRKLTPCDFTVLRMIALGYSNRRIAHEMGLTISVVRERITGLFQKRGVECRAQLAVEAVRVGAIVVEVQR